MEKNLEDFGEQIGGARKDLRGNLGVKDLEVLTQIEQAKLVRKDMVWPTPDYEKMVGQGGYTRDAALMIKILRDSLPASPGMSPGESAEAFMASCAVYIETIEGVRRMERCKTLDEMVNVFTTDEIFRSRVAKRDVTNNLFGTKRGYTVSWAPGIRNSVFGLSPNRFYRAFSDATFSIASGEKSRAASLLLRRNPDWPLGVSPEEAFLRKMNLRIGSMGVYGKEGRYAVFRYGEPIAFSAPSQSVLAELGRVEFTSEEEGRSILLAAAKTVLTARRAAAKAKRDAILGLAKGQTEGEGVYRVGPVWRENDTNVDGEAYLNELRLRGGEFGLWVDQAERQQVLNRGFDAFKDLASILQWRPDQLSIGGGLAIAFGARGHGGPVLAHYEPGRKVMNLTKPHGEGCLAHEYWHAVDHWLGEQAITLGLRQTPTEMPFLSDMSLKPAEKGKQASPEERMIREMHALMERSARKLVTPTIEDDRERLLTYIRSDEKSLRNELIAGRAYLEKLAAGRVNSGAIMEGYDAAVGKLFEDIGKSVAPEEFKRTVRALMGRTGSMSRIAINLSYYSGGLRTWTTLYQERLNPDFQPKPHVVSTDYAKACLSLDKEKAKPYWSLRHEMAARSFEVFVADTLKSSGRVNPFLVSGTGGQAYPQGEDRQVLVSAFTATIKNLGEFLTPRPIVIEKTEAANEAAKLPEHHVGVAATVARSRH